MHQLHGQAVLKNATEFLLPLASFEENGVQIATKFFIQFMICYVIWCSEVITCSCAILKTMILLLQFRATGVQIYVSPQRSCKTINLIVT